MVMESRRPCMHVNNVNDASRLQAMERSRFVCRQCEAEHCYLRSYSVSNSQPMTESYEDPIDFEKPAQWWISDASPINATVDAHEALSERIYHSCRLSNMSWPWRNFGKSRITFLSAIWCKLSQAAAAENALDGMVRGSGWDCCFAIVEKAHLPVRSEARTKTNYRAQVAPHLGTSKSMTISGTRVRKPKVSQAAYVF